MGADQFAAGHGGGSSMIVPSASGPQFITSIKAQNSVSSNSNIQYPTSLS
jgi:hypothetical protein